MKSNAHIKFFSLRLIYLLLLADVGVLLWLILSHDFTLWLKLAVAGITCLLMWLLWIGVVRPRRMIQIGMELLSAQEANNRLAPVGQPEADRIARLFNTLMDRIHTERLRLREQNFFLGQLIKSSPMGVMILDFDYNITDLNPAFLKLSSLPATSGLIGTNLKDLPGQLGGLLNEMKDGDIRTIRLEDHTILRCYSLSFMECGFRRPFILLESLTEEVIQAQRSAYGKVIRLMAHEVNNSMTGISTLLEILSSYHKDDPELSEFITSVSERCGAMGRFIAAYADVVRLPDPSLKKINLSDFLSAQLPFLRSNSPYPVEAQWHEENLEIEADPDMLSQILVNIIKNSSEAIAETGREDGLISISAGCDRHRRCELIITDNGCGISPATAKDLFNPFFSTKPDGQGIGLTMVAEILRRHNASFTLRTESDGLTRFRIIFK